MLLVAGAGGFLGRSFTLEAIASGRAVLPAIHKSGVSLPGIQCVTADLSDARAARDLIELHKPAWVINCAGFTNVDQCEREPERAVALNVELPRNLAMACAQAGIGLVHISTDSVFDGERGSYTEDDAPAPLNVYSRSKLDGEYAVQEVLPEALVIRTNFVGLSETGTTGLADWISGRLEQGQRINGFTDVVFAPLFANELARIILSAIDLNLAGLFHASASNACSKYDFAVRLGEALGFDTTLVGRARIGDAEMFAPRPLNTSLVPLKLERALGRQMPSVDSAVDAYAGFRTGRLSGRS